MNFFNKPNNTTPETPQPPSFQAIITSLQTQISNTLKTHFPNFPKLPKSPVFARVSMPTQRSMSSEDRMAGVPVYALTNAVEEFVLVSGVRTGKSLALLCFNENDAVALMEQMRSMDPSMRHGSKVVPVALNKIFQLKVDGVAFRLIPDKMQVKNAIEERQRTGLSDDGFPGVPVFQSSNLILKTEDKSYRPVFFRKEDLENSLARASNQQNRLNAAPKGDIQVAVLEDVIKGMTEGSASNWTDVVFIPPGLDIATDPSQQRAAR